VTADADKIRILGAELNLANTGYKQPQNEIRPSMDFSGDSGRFDYINYFIRSSVVDFAETGVILTDGIGHKVKNTVIGEVAGRWRHVYNEISVKEADRADWSGDTQYFYWNDVRFINVFADGGAELPARWWTGDYINVDGLVVVNLKGWKINRATSYGRYHLPVFKRNVETYGASVLNHEDENIKCFEHAVKIGKMLNSVNGQPFKKVTVTKGAKVWAKPSQYLTLDVPEFGISNEEWRIIEMITEWRSAGNLLRTRFVLVPKDYGLPVETAKMDTWGGILSKLMKMKK